MESSFVVPDPSGGHAVLDGFGRLLRRGHGPASMQGPAPEWWIELFETWQAYFNAVLDPTSNFDIRFDVPNEGVTAFQDAKVYLDAMSSPHNGVWFRVQRSVNEVAIITPLHYVRYLRLEVKRPHAFHVFHPTLLQDGLATHFGKQYGATKGYVLPDKFVGKIKAPICPFCLESMVLSMLVENLGAAGQQENIQKHLWLCRLCSPASTTPTALIASTARELKDEASTHAHLEERHED